MMRGARRLHNMCAATRASRVMSHADGICHNMYFARSRGSGYGPRVWCRCQGSTRRVQCCRNAIVGISATRRWTVACRRCPPRAWELRLAKNAQAPPAMNARPEQTADTEYGVRSILSNSGKVAGLDQALATLPANGSRHTEFTVTQDPVAATRFLAEVDSACVSHMPAPFRTDTVWSGPSRSGILLRNCTPAPGRLGGLSNHRGFSYPFAR